MMTYLYQKTVVPISTKLTEACLYFDPDEELPAQKSH